MGSCTKEVTKIITGKFATGSVLIHIFRVAAEIPGGPPSLSAAMTVAAGIPIPVIILRYCALRVKNVVIPNLEAQGVSIPSIIPA
jgi:hypothetical protein